MADPEQIETVIIGAGPAGLAVGACLQRAGRPAVILEQRPALAPSWRGHYDRLHLHTDKRNSALPYQPWPATSPRYFRGKQVLVVGFGNSGGELAIDLHERGAAPSLAVRGPVNAIPRPASVSPTKPRPRSTRWSSPPGSARGSRSSSRRPAR